LKELSKSNSDVAKVEIVQKNTRNCWVAFTLKIGSMQDLLAILKNAKLEALSLHRYRIGNLNSDMLTPGSWKQLNSQEVALLFATDPAGASFFFK
jgi:16S rRNA U516 pseudouridylate synthase RsuA-like enzyme